MDRFIIHPPPSIKDVTKSIRERRVRSICIEHDFDSFLAQVASDPTTDIGQFIARYIDPRNTGMAVMAYSIHRFPFNPIPPGTDLNRWVSQYLPIIMGDFKTVRDFIELADNINQLSAMYAFIPDPEKHWEVMYRHALYNSHGDTFSDIAASDMEDLPLDDPGFMDTIRIGLYVSDMQNVPGESPRDIAGNPIDPDLFARIQRSFWQEEFRIRSNNVIDLYDHGGLSDDKEIRNTISQVLQYPPPIDILPFQRLVKWQRLAITVHKAGISDIRIKDSLFRILQVDRLGFLGVQGLAACLPSYGDSYELPFIFELCTLNSQIDAFFDNHVSKRQEAWFDGWFEKYPVSGSIDHVTLDIDYYVESDGWNGKFLERKGDSMKHARAIGLDDEDMEFLWGTHPQTPAEISATPPDLDIVDEVISWYGSKIDVNNAFARSDHKTHRPKLPGCYNNYLP